MKSKVFGHGGLVDPGITWSGLIFVLLNAIDCILTKVILAVGYGAPTFSEANPIWDVDGYGLVYKMIAAVAVALLFGRNKFVLWALNIGLVAVILWFLTLIQLYWTVTL